MKAIVYTEYGPPEVLHTEEVEKPVPKKDEVLIKVHATTVTAGDWRMRKPDPFLARVISGLFRPKRITTPGIEFSGEITAIGKEVTEFKEGDRVFGSPGFGTGACAEYLCVPESGDLTTKPINLSHEEAATVPVGGNTALYFLRDKGNIQSGQTVLVYGASGSVGTYAVQLARYFGTKVTGVCSTSNLELVKSLGAEKIIDYTKEDFTEADDRYDLIFDAVGKLKRGDAKKALASGGTFVTVNRGLARSRRDNLVFLKKLIEAGQIKPVIDRSYTLDRIVEAHRYVEKGHKKGNVVVAVEQAGLT